MVMSVLFFLLIAFPVTLQLEKFWNWGKDLFLHSGQYGSGEENIVNIPKLKENFLQIIQLQKYFSIVTGMLIILVVFSYFKMKKNRDSKLRKIVIVTFSVLLSIAIQVIMAGKHYEVRYFLPALMLGPLLIYLLAETLLNIFPSKYLKFGLMAAIGVFIVWNINVQKGTINFTSEAFEKQISARKQTKNIVETLEKESIKIIVSQDYGCPMIEYALHFSTVWSYHKLRPQYVERLAEMYPNTYQYTTWDGKFIYWGEPFDAEKIIDLKIPVYLYLENGTEELYNKTIEKLLELGKTFKVENSTIFENQVNGERILKLSFFQPIETS
jgi:hypothetical protein